MTPPLPPSVVVLPGTDVSGAWERFEVFEALHHGMRICNPMEPSDLEAVLDLLALSGGESMLDVACGHGELLIRAAEEAAVEGLGVDLSPWALTRAVAETERRRPPGSLTWCLGDGRAVPAEPREVVACLGAPWVWSGFTGTARALAGHCRPGSAAAIGDLVAKEGAGPPPGRGRVPTLSDQAAALREAGFGRVEALVVPDASFDAYDTRVEASASAWAQQHPGPRADRYLEEQRRWAADQRRDREFLSWVVWVGRRA